MSKTHSFVTALCAIALFSGAPALANEEICDGVVTSTFDDDVKVPGGATCTLDGATVKGNLKVESGGALVTTGATVKRNVQTNEASYIQILDTKIDGNLQIHKTTGVPPAAPANQVCDSKIDGDLQLVDNKAAFEIGCVGGNHVGGNLQVDKSDIDRGTIVIANNAVRGDLQYKDNGTDSAADLSDNEVKQHLQCDGNTPAPTGSGNTANEADDQCAALATETDSGKFADLEPCDGTFGKEQFDDVTVPGGATCTLNGTKVKGNIQVESGGTLVATDAKVKGNIQVESGGALDADGVKVKGSIQTDEATDVLVVESKVKGNVQINKTSGTPPGGGPNAVSRSRIKGDLQVTKNTESFALEDNKVKGNLQVQDNDIDGGASETVITVTENKVRGDLQFHDNNAGAGGFDVSGNKVKQNLQCDGNTPAPTGSGNEVKGDAEDQCAGL